MSAVLTPQIWVPGRPEPKGSMTRIPPRRPGGKAVWINDNPRYNDWEDTMVEVMRLLAGNKIAEPINDAVELIAEFYLPRPGKTKFRDAPIGEGIGDLDKLIRGAGDAIKKAGIYRDDSRIARIVAEKVYASPVQPAGARIQLLPYTPPVDATRGPVPVRLQVGRTNRLVGSLSHAKDLPRLLRAVADQMEKTYAA
jgi:Holliday junction resolvase RusA-like endonuclease